MKYRRIILINIFGFMLSACGVGGVFGIADMGAEENIQFVAPAVDSPAPNFELLDLNGKLVQLEDYRGQVVMLNFWATWCPPCRLEMPTLNSRYEAHSTEFTVLAVNFAEQENVVEEFALELGLSFPVLLDSDGAIQEQYQVRGYPSSVFIDADGIIRIIHIGILTDGQLDSYLAELGIGER